jgi:hypothetical protein
MFGYFKKLNKNSAAATSAEISFAFNAQQNPYHLVDPSPWPIVLSFSLPAFAAGLVLFFHGAQA